MQSLKSLLSGFVAMEALPVAADAGEELVVAAYADGASLGAEVPMPQAKIPTPQRAPGSRLVELPIAGQGTVGVEVAHFERPPPGYRIALLDSSRRLVFVVSVEDRNVAIERLEGDRVVARSVVTPPSPMIDFAASSMAIWVSVDRNNHRVSFGCGYMMRRTSSSSCSCPITSPVARCRAWSSPNRSPSTRGARPA